MHRTMSHDVAMKRDARIAEDAARLDEIRQAFIGLVRCDAEQLRHALRRRHARVLLRLDADVNDMNLPPSLGGIELLEKAPVEVRDRADEACFPKLPTQE